MLDKKKKSEPIKEDPEDVVGTIYCKEGTEEYNNIINGNDMLPYVSPLPKIRRAPEPPII